jgi:hypothetical protein
MRLTRDSLAAILATTAFAVVVVLGFYKTRGPSTQRLLRYDQKRIGNISALANEIHTQFHVSEKHPPAELTEVQKKKYQDPATNQPLEYSAKPPTQFTICTAFALPTQNDEEQKVEFAFWTHSAGHKCFEFDAAGQIPQAPYNYYNYF